jgi:hypothetical protein
MMQVHAAKFNGRLGPCRHGLVNQGAFVFLTRPSSL